jgi:hypothetical protein
METRLAHQAQARIRVLRCARPLVLLVCIRSFIFNFRSCHIILVNEEILSFFESLHICLYHILLTMYYDAYLSSDNITATAGPNGDIDYFDCGISTAQGWNPPQLTISDLVSVNLSTALNASSSSPFQECGEYISLFEKHAEQNDCMFFYCSNFRRLDSFFLLE